MGKRTWFQLWVCEDCLFAVLGSGDWPNEAASMAWRSLKAKGASYGVFVEVGKSKFRCELCRRADKEKSKVVMDVMGAA